MEDRVSDRGRRDTVAYFSMEMALHSRVPTYSGGLGVLAGDAMRAAADCDMPMVGVTLLYRDGHFRQRLDDHGRQHEEPVDWTPSDWLEELPQRASVWIEGRTVALRAWRYCVRGNGGHEVPVVLLDSDLPENDGDDREITRHLYGGDERLRLSQEAILGLGGIAMLRALGHEQVVKYHLNEGHSSLLAVALLREQLARRSAEALAPADVEAVRDQCVFTTHTPVAQGHDRFPLALVEEVLDAETVALLRAIDVLDGAGLDMTVLALRCADRMNGVSMRHGEVSRGMFPGHAIEAITNGVHVETWTASPWQELFDRHIPGWRQENALLRYASSLPLDEVEAAHGQAKRALLAAVEERTGRRLSAGALTIGFARRATEYKRAGLVFADLDWLRAIARECGPLQFVFSGKAHPRDEGGKALIRHVFEFSRALGEEIPVVYLEDYEMDLARLLCAGSDVWLNTPVRPLEASGTSGMKAALNGVPSLSILDGWWIEGHVEGVTGWSIGDARTGDPAYDAPLLYEKLGTVAALFHRDPGAFARVRRSAVALNGSFFNAERMMRQYAVQAYGLTLTP